ncbi:MAG: YaeQ family protein [Methylophilaceae bacterium]
MAIKATIFKANLQIADMERHYYQDHTLTLAQHPSETEERMMVRLLVFALHANEYLEFGQGMTDDEEADLWLKDLTGAIKLWIDVGIPDEKLIRKACGRAEQVVVYCYGGRIAEMWFAQNKAQFERQKNLTIINLPQESTQGLAKLAQRSMSLQCTIQDEQVWLSDGNASVQVERVVLKTAIGKNG